MRKLISSIGLLAVTMLLTAASAFASDGTGASSSLVGVGAAIAVGIPALGGTLGQGKAVSAALESIGRNPSAAGKLLTPMILGLALIESLVILSWVIANNLAGKI